MINLLQEGMKNGTVIPTDLSRRLTIDGITKAYQVYKIRLDQLYYNDQNDRIATWISQYKSDHGVEEISMDDFEQYNSIIQDFIVKSNPGAIHKTKANIELVDQREPGVVLLDGRIIDGNRRFTCLRMLSATNDRYKYFEAAILDKDIHNNEKQVKMLELAIQHGEEGKIDYNPIDRLVGVYQDIIDKKLLTLSEYARITNTTEGDVKKLMDQALLMVDFLEFINAPKQFHIARELELDGPLIELVGIMRKCKDDDTREDVKNSVFANLVMKPHGDMTRFIRQFKPIVESDVMDQFLAEQVQLAEAVISKIPSGSKVNDKVLNEVIRTDEDLKGQLEHSMEKAITKVKRTETRNRPTQLVEKSFMALESIDQNILVKLSEEERNRFLGKLEDLDDLIEEIRSKLADQDESME